MKGLTVIIAAVALLGGTALLTGHGRATAFSAPNHNCPAVPTLRSFKRGYPILIQTRNVSCAQALTFVQAMESGVGVTFVGNPEPRFAVPLEALRPARLDVLRRRQRLSRSRGRRGLLKGAATVEWYHA